MKARCYLSALGRAVSFASLSAALIAGLSGCSSVEMKGTPFYTGEYGIRKGHAEDRVNVWPLLYYREPALSIAWPFIEKTDEHIALRPVFSLYGLDEPDRVYSVLWPLAQFDFKRHEHRIFPAFWGQDYACVFPLYWHLQHPQASRGGVDTLFPLWWYDWDSSGYSAWLAGPLLHFKDCDHATGWHIGPLLGNYEDDQHYYRFQLWPLAHQWSRDRTTESGAAVLPLYWYSRDRTGSRFLSLLYSGGHNAENDDRWNLLLPVFYNRQAGDKKIVATLLGGWRTDKDRSSWVAIPALSGGRRSADSGDLWLLGPMAHRGWSPKHTSSHIVPLYYREQEGSDSLFVSLLWSAGKRSDVSWELVPPVYYHRQAKSGEARVALLYAQGRSELDHSEWNTLLPLYYRSSSPTESMLATLFGGYSADADGHHWLIFPLLSWGHRSADSGDLWFLGPMAHRGWSPKHISSHIAPLYYREQEGSDSLFVSLPWSAGKRGDVSWELVPPVYYHRQAKSGEARVALLYAQGRSELDHSEWNTLLPLYYRSSSPTESMLATLLGGYSADTEGHHWLIYPLLSWGRWSADTRDLWLAAPFFHSHSVQGKVAQQHLLPLYYLNRATDTLLSPLFAHWGNDGGSTTTLAPPLLSFYSSAPQVSELWALAGLAHFSWGREAQSDHVLPLYYRNFKTGTFVSAPFMRWGDDESRTTFVPPALSWTTRRPRRSDAWLLGPLAHFSWGEEAQSDHVLPLYYRNFKTGTFLSAPFMRWGDDESRTTFVPPALSWTTRRPRRSDAWLLGPLAHFSWGEDARSEHVLPLYYRNFKTGTFLSAPFMRWGDDESRTTLIPPLLSWKTQRPRCSDLWLLGPLAHLSWGEDATTSHVLPLYYADSRNDLFASLLYTSWTDGGVTNRVIPPLLSAYTRDGEKRELYGLLGMFYQQWGAGAQEGSLIPLYFYDGTKTFFSPLFGWKRTGDTQYMYPATPLLGFWGGRKTGGWLFPLFSYRGDKDGTDYGGNFLWGWYGRRGGTYRSGMFPLYGYQRHGAAPPTDAPAEPGSYGKKFWSLPICWYRSEVGITHPARADGSYTRSEHKSNGCFPLWSYTSDTQPGQNHDNTSGSFLLLLYDYMRTVKPDAAAPGGRDEYVRTRVLWRLWHYERANEDVSVDVFPAITYDRRGDTFRKTSFLWRMFRYERGPEGRKVDLLFLPVVRQKGKAE